MSEERFDKVVWTRFPKNTVKIEPLDEINQELQNGYKIMDIVPYLTESGGAIFTTRRGLYYNNLLFHLAPTNQKTKIYSLTIKPDNSKDTVDKINAAIAEEGSKGHAFLKLIPATGIIEPQNSNGMGRGTYAFCLFFIDELEN